MPKEITSKAEFEKLLDRASEVRVFRNGDSAKIKLRTRDTLYTFKTTGAEADTLTKPLKIPVTEF